MFLFMLSQLAIRIFLYGSLLCLGGVLLAGCSTEIRNPITISDKATQ